LVFNQKKPLNHLTFSYQYHLGSLPLSVHQRLLGGNIQVSPYALHGTKAAAMNGEFNFNMEM
jgi:hypothetical protein